MIQISQKSFFSLSHSLQTLVICNYYHHQVLFALNYKQTHVLDNLHVFFLFVCVYIIRTESKMLQCCNVRDKYVWLTNILYFKKESNKEEMSLCVFIINV